MIVLVFGVLNALSSGGQGTLGPAYAKASAIGVDGWALILSAGACGLVVTSLVFLRVPLRRPLLWGMLGCSLHGAPLVALGLTDQLWIIVVCAFVGGAGIEIFGLGWELAMQEHVPADMLGSFIAIPVGQLAFGPLGTAYGRQHMILLAGVAYFVIALATLSSRSVREMQRAGATSTTSEPVS